MPKRKAIAEVNHIGLLPPTLYFAMQEMKRRGSNYVFAHSQGSHFAYYVVKRLRYEHNVEIKAWHAPSYLLTCFIHMSAMTSFTSSCTCRTGALREQLRRAQRHAVTGPQHFAEEATRVGKRDESRESTEHLMQIGHRVSSLGFQASAPQF